MTESTPASTDSDNSDNKDLLVGVAWGSPGCPVLPVSIRRRMISIRIPPELVELFGMQLTYDQLDSNILKKCGMGYLPERASRIIRDTVDIRANLQPDDSVVPSGVTLALFRMLPLSRRAKNAIATAYQIRGDIEESSAPLTVRSFLAVPGAGVTTCIEVLCVLESAGYSGLAGRPQLPAEYTTRTESETEEQSADEYDEHSHESESFATLTGPLQLLASWAQSETAAFTLGEAIEEGISRSDEDAGWETISKTVLLEIAQPALHPYALLDSWSQQLDERESEVLVDRVANDKGFTLQDIGDRHSITRERVRQIEAKVTRKLQEFIGSEPGRPIRWRANTLQRILGVGAPYRVVSELLKVPPEVEDYSKVLLDIAGPYERVSNWLIRADSKETDPTRAIISMADEYGRIDLVEAFRKLEAWGLDSSFHYEWLSQHPAIRNFNGQLVVWGQSVGDRIAFALADLAHPASIQELMKHVQEETTRGSVQNAIAVDPRIIRIDRSAYALKSWGQAEFISIADSIRSLLRQTGHPIRLRDIVHKLSDSHDVAAHSVQTYAYAPMFVVEDGYVRERTKAEPFEYPHSTLRRTAGVFSLGPRRVGLMKRVDEDMLRGSGRPIGHAAGAILLVEVGERLTFRNSEENAVYVTFPETSFLGPTIGSVRAIAERLEASVGDYLTLILDRTDMSISASLTSESEEEESWERVSQLTGIDAQSGMDRLAIALRCEEAEIQSVLQSRGDEVVLNALPKSLAL